MLFGISLQDALLWGTVAALLNFAPYRPAAGAAAGGRLPGPAYRGGPGGDPDRAGAAHEAVATGADPGTDGVRLGLGHDRAAAGSAAAGVHQAGAGTAGRHAGLGAPAGMKARAGRRRMVG
ncbi:hypothetical protein G6F63_014892 [Rhizopus arrhizus]|nr:hypothetical protein G6F63_014892 [Rhizopus arrhizus]